MLDLLLVNPGNSEKMYQGLASPLRAIEPPFWAGLIASFIRDRGYSVAILDADAENWSSSYTAERAIECNPRLVAVIVQGVNPSASSTPKMSAAIDLVHELKEAEPDIKVLAGGLHPSALPERTLRETGADFVCQGEGFYTILELLGWIKSGQVDPFKVGEWRIDGLWYMQDGRTVSNPRAGLLRSEELPPVAWDLLDMTKYRAHNWSCLDDLDRRSPYAVVYTSLGCCFDCAFCQVKQMYGGKPGMRFRPPEKVIEEIDLLVSKYGVRNIKIMDELFTVSERQVASICDPIIERGYDLNITQYYGRIDIVTKPMLAKMKQAGMRWACYAIESASEKSRLGVGKKFSRDIESGIEMARELDMPVMANFIFGLPDDDLESMQSTLDMMKEYLFEYVNLYTFQAYPGSQLYDSVSIEHPEWLPETWDGYAQLGYETKPLPTRYLTAEQVLAFRDKAFYDYFSYPQYQEMIRRKFGEKAVEHVRGMLQHKLRRKLLGD